MIEKWVCSKLHLINKDDIDAVREAAISKWENDIKHNKEGYKIVRGLDGKPVEIVLVEKSEKPFESIFAVFVNGKNREQFQINGTMQSMETALGNLRFEQFLTSNVFEGWYEIKGIKRFETFVQKMHEGFVFGLSGPQPDTLPVNFRAN